MPRICALLFLLPLAGCRHAPVEATGTGSSAFTVVQAGQVAEPKVTTGKGEAGEGDIKPAAYDRDWLAAVPLKGQPLPVYPERALKAKAGAATVGVRVTVDATGRVTDIGPSLLVFNTPGPSAEAFLEATKAAVRSWRFRPAEILHMEQVDAPGVSYKRVARREPVESQLDLSFSFTATGGVQAGR